MSTTSYTITVTDISNIALRKLGVNIQGGTATTEQSTEAMQALNVMCGRFFTMGMPFYREASYTISTLVSGTNTYSITDSGDSSGGLFNVYQAFLRNTTTNIDIPLRVISREEYNSMTNKTQTGVPVMVALAPDGLTASLYLTPDSTTAANNTVVLYGYRNESVYTALTDNLAFPREWGEALIYGLCVRLAPEYGVALDVLSGLKTMADEALKDAKDWNPEVNSTYFGVSNYGRK